MGLLDKLHTIIDTDVAKLFSGAKQANVIANTEVERLEAALLAARQRAIDTARETKAHAEAAAEAARKAADELAIEAKAAAERMAFHSGKLPQLAEPGLDASAPGQ